MRLGIIATALLLAACPMFAASIHSDDFNGTALDPQWTAFGAGGTASVSGGRLHMNAVYNGAASNSQQTGIKSSTGYVLSGDFEMIMDFNVDSYNTNGGTILAIACIRSGSNFLSLQHRNGGSGWFEWAFMQGSNGASNTQNPSGMEDVSYRFRRVGNVTDWALKVGETWSVINAMSDFGTGDVTFETYSWALQSGSSLNMSVDAISVPEPVTMSLLAVGGVACVVRRKRK